MGSFIGVSRLNNWVYLMSYEYYRLPKSTINANLSNIKFVKISN